MSVGLLGAGDLANSLTEIEEESNPYVNNGLPVVRSFSGITRNQQEAEQYFFLIQLMINES